MRKLALLVVVVTMVLSLTGCGGGAVDYSVEIDSFINQFLDHIVAEDAVGLASMYADVVESNSGSNEPITPDSISSSYAINFLLYDFHSATLTDKNAVISGKDAVVTIFYDLEYGPSDEPPISESLRLDWRLQRVGSNKWEIVWQDSIGFGVSVDI